MNLSKESVEAIARDAIPTWDNDDQDVRNYLVQIFTDPDSYSDVENLKQVLLPFVGDSYDIANTIVENLMTVVGSNGSLKESRSNEAPLRIDSDTGQKAKGFLGESLSQNFCNDTKENGDMYEKHGKLQENQNAVKGKKDRRTKRQERLQKKRQDGKPSTQPRKARDNNEDATEDDASAWNERQTEGKHWGGRGYGGRGEYAGKVNNIKSNIHLSNVSISLANGTELLQNTTMDITANHRYALVGRNGVGKFAYRISFV